MTNKRLDKKFMSWVWGIIRLFPFLPIFIILLTFLFQYNSGYWEFGTSDIIKSLDSGIFDFMFNNYGPFESFYDNIPNYMLPTFMYNFYNDILSLFNISFYNFFALPIAIILYQVWISILQILFNVLMILPNIANYFLEKFAHAGNKKGDY